ncbi:MAG: glycosyltransferase family 2 protein [Acidimicrobiales bacterium]
MTARPTVTLVLDGTNGSPAVLSELAAVLRGALGPADRMVVVDPTPSPLRVEGDGAPPARPAPAKAGRVQRRTNTPGLLAALAAERPTDVMVVVDATVVIPHVSALTELAAVLEAAGATAAVPASNGGAYPQCPPDPLDPAAARADIRAEARRCLERDRGRHHRLNGATVVTDVTDATAAWGGVVAVAPGALIENPTIAPALGDRPDPAGPHGLVRAVWQSLMQANPSGPVVVAAGAYVHSLAPAPLVSVCLIVKNEAEDLPACLASVATVADEVIVYDTGSTDNTVDVARELGATVIEGEWRNDFGWARNQAMAAARGTWILSIDADERLELDDGAAAPLRSLLRRDPPVDRFIVDLFDLQGSIHAPVRTSSAVPMARLFRRRHCRWVGALHEQPEDRPGLTAARIRHLPGVALLHRGYLDEIVAGKGKWQRNLSVATAGLVDLPHADKDCFDLARSLRSVGEHGRALTLFERAADLGQNPVITRGALEFVILTLTETAPVASTDHTDPEHAVTDLDELDELGQLAEPYLARLEAMNGGAEPARYLRGWVAIRQRRWTAAATCFEGVGDYHDHFTGFRVESVPLGLALAYRGLGRTADAATQAAAALQRNPLALDAWAVLFDTTAAGAPEETQLMNAISAEHLVALVAALSRFDAEHRDRLCEARWSTHPGDTVVLAAAAQTAPHLHPDAALRWSARLRASGLHELCPFRSIAADESRTLPDRAVTVTIAIEGLDLVAVDASDLVDALEGLVGQLPDLELGAVLDRCLAQSPAAAGPLVIAGAATVARCVVIMDSLVRAGFGEQALAVLSHAADADPAATRMALQTRPALVQQLRESARAEGRQDLVAVLPQAA